MEKNIENRSLNEKKFRKSNSIETLVKVMSGALLVTAFAQYFIYSFGVGTLDYRKWSAIKQERKIQKERNFRKSIEEEFSQIDIDRNGCLDFAEFYKMARKDYRGGEK